MGGSGIDFMGGICFADSADIDFADIDFADIDFADIDCIDCIDCIDIDVMMDWNARSHGQRAQQQQAWNKFHFRRRGYVL